MESRDERGRKDIMEGSSIFFYGCGKKISGEGLSVFSLQQPPESLGPWKHSISTSSSESESFFGTPLELTYLNTFACSQISGLVCARK